MNRGRFITLEGGEGAGKSTQAALLSSWLEGQQIEVVRTREPGGTPGAEAIRSLLLGDDGQGWDAPAEALLFAAARSDHVARVIRPALDRGAWVVCDRYIDSTRAYQGGGGGLTDASIMELHRIGSDGLLPDRTILLQLDAAEAEHRLAARDLGVSDRIGGRARQFHEAVAKAFAELAGNEPERFVVIDAANQVEAVQSQLQAAVRPLVESA